jgi:sugar phosphate isomerase/epimerase
MLAASGGLAAGLAVAALVRPAAAADQKKPALCLGCRDGHLRDIGEKDCWSALGAIGAEGVEAGIRDDLTLPGLFHPSRRYSLASQAEIEALRADAKAAGRRITALCMSNRFDERPEFEVEWCGRAARAAAALGVAAIRIDVVPQRRAKADFLELAVRTLSKTVQATAATGVAFAIENHGSTTNDPEFLMPLLERVGSPRLGVTLDTANLYWFGHPLAKVYAIYEMLAPYVRHTHCKNIRFPEARREQRRPVGWEYERYNCPLYEGDIDFHRVVKTLRRAGYTGDLCIEDESLGKFPAAERRGILAKEIQYLKECL